MNAPNSGSESFSSQMPCARALREARRVHFSASAMSDVPTEIPQPDDRQRFGVGHIVIEHVADLASEQMQPARADDERPIVKNSDR